MVVCREIFVNIHRLSGIRGGGEQLLLLSEVKGN